MVTTQEAIKGAEQLAAEQAAADPAARVVVPEPQDETRGTGTPPADEVGVLRARLESLERENQRLRSIEGNQRQRANLQGEVARLGRKLNLVLERQEQEADDPAFKERLDRLSAEDRTSVQQERLAGSLERTSQRHAQSLTRLLQRHGLAQASVPGLAEIAQQWGTALGSPTDDTREELDDLYGQGRDLIEDYVAESQKKATAAAVKEAEQKGRDGALKERTRVSSLSLTEPEPAGGTRSGAELIKAFADFESDDLEGALKEAKRLGVRLSG